MKKFAMLSVVMALVCGATVVHAAEEWKMPVPTSQHKWLDRFVGDWVSDVSIYMAPGKPPMKAKATESFKKIGGFWVQGEGHGEMGNMKHTHIFTIGYSAEKKKYIGSWIDSNTDIMWRYEGLVSGNTLTLKARGACPGKPGQMTDFKEVTEFKSKNHRVFKSYMLDKGKWVLMIVMDSKKK